MTSELLSSGGMTGIAAGALALRAGPVRLRALLIAAGLCWSVLFVVIGLVYELQMYADGSIFSYAVAVRDSWGFHWHNIPGRLLVYLFSHLPAEIYVRLTADPRGGIALYGLLFFVAPLLGLAATFAADRSDGRIYFRFACLSTACLCPLLFGSPTEMRMAQSLFWPALTVCHYARAGLAGGALVLAALLALVFTHEGAVIFALAILLTLLLRGWRDAALRRATIAFLLVMAMWGAVKVMIVPDEYTGTMMHRAALHVLDIDIFTGDLMRLLLATLAGYGLLFVVFRRVAPAKAHIYAGGVVAAALGVYWTFFDHALHAENRYYLRTVVLIATPMLGLMAARRVLGSEGRLVLPLKRFPVKIFTDDAIARVAAGAFLLVMLVHAVETAKFISAWARYKDAVRELAMSTQSDPALGDPRFVSSQRVAGADNRLAWSSTTHFLSVLVAPRLAPARLVVDPNAGYFWLPCELARASEAADVAVPAQSRRLMRVHACLHR